MYNDDTPENRTSKPSLCFQMTITVVHLSSPVVLHISPHLFLYSQIDTWCKENRYFIAGYYQANERAKDFR